MRKIGILTVLFLLIVALPATADINSDFMKAAAKGDSEVVKSLLAKGAEVNAKDKKYDMTALMFAAKEGYTEVVKSLLARGADVNAKDKVGWTATMLAAQSGHTEVVKSLLAKGAEVNAKNKGGITALMFATKEGHSEVVKSLLANGADVNAKDKTNGASALLIAIHEGHSEVVKSLLANGADVNEKDKRNGATALMFATQNGHIEIIKILLKKGADVNVRKEGGKTALDFAEGFDDIVNLLKKYGTKKASELKPSKLVLEELNKESVLIKRGFLYRKDVTLDSDEYFIEIDKVDGGIFYTTDKSVTPVYLEI